MSIHHDHNDLYELEERLRRSKPATEPLPNQFKRQLYADLLSQVEIDRSRSPLNVPAARFAFAGMAVLMLLLVIGISPAGSAIADLILTFGPFAVTGEPSAAEAALTIPPQDVVTPNVLGAGLSSAAEVAGFTIFYPRYWPDGYERAEPPVVSLVANEQGQLIKIEDMRLNKSNEAILYYSQSPFSSTPGQELFDLGIGDAQAERVMVGNKDALWLKDYVAGTGRSGNPTPANVLIWQDSSADGQDFLFWLNSYEPLPLPQMLRIARSVTTAESGPSEHLNVAFGAALRFSGYELTEPRGALRLYWQTNTTVPKDYTLFVHWRDENGVIVAQTDQPLPSSQWRPGERIVETIELSGLDLPVGDVTISMGLYDPDSLHRLPLEENPAGELQLATVSVSEEIQGAIPEIEDELALTQAAMDTVIAYNQSGSQAGGEPPFLGVSPELWAQAISDLDPIRVYWHFNNLALVFAEEDNVERGLYIGVPISSYAVESGPDFRLSPFGNGLWQFERSS